MELHCLHWFQFENTLKITLNTEIKKISTKWGKITLISV